MMMKTTVQNAKQLNALAIALVEAPNANLKELAEACGISKATLYRFCRTRNLLIETLENYALEVLDNIITSADLEGQDPKVSLRYLSEECFNQQNIILFLTHFWRSANPNIQKSESEWLCIMDDFFLRGQKIGAFRIDIPAPAMSDIWINLMVGLMEAERKGRVARLGVTQLLEVAFLHGVQSKN
ncbi:TPA: transcriptional regulator [Providencia rettgeri]|nr:transcriptional regulator [Providencia rettgeri]